MKQRYQIITIYEEDHGCEGIPEGEEPMDQVLLRTEDGVGGASTAYLSGAGRAADL